MKRAGTTSPIAADPQDAERRIEDWLVCHLENGRSQSESLLSLVDWHETISELSLCWATPKSKPSPTQQARAERTQGWKRFRVHQIRDLMILRLTDALLIKEADIREFADELTDLIEAGYHRLVLDFARVERLSSQAVGALAAAARRCQLAEGGLLKVCRLHPDVAPAFVLVGLARAIVVAADEPAAMNGPWPAKAPQALPLSILSALTGDAEECDTPDGASVHVDSHRATAEPPRVCLVVEAGRFAGRAIVVRGPQFVIGRDPECDVRSRSVFLSRRHAAIDTRRGRITVRDLGSTNGTRLNRIPLGSDGEELRNGDRLVVGPLRFLVRIGAKPAAPSAEDLIAGWLVDPADREGGTTPAGSPGETEAESGESAASETLFDVDARAGLLKKEVIQDVLVLTPQLSHIDGEPAERALRAELFTLFESPLPRRVVINLANIAHLSSRAVGILVAHLLRLQRAGGSLRLCQPHVRIHAALDHLQLPMLIGTYPSVDEAVVSNWE